MRGKSRLWPSILGSLGFFPVHVPHSSRFPLLKLYKGKGMFVLSFIRLRWLRTLKGYKFLSSSPDPPFFISQRSAQCFPILFMNWVSWKKYEWARNYLVRDFSTQSYNWPKQLVQHCQLGCCSQDSAGRPHLVWVSKALSEFYLTLEADKKNIVQHFPSYFIFKLKGVWRASSVYL